MTAKLIAADVYWRTLPAHEQVLVPPGTDLAEPTVADYIHDLGNPLNDQPTRPKRTRKARR